MLLCLTSFHLVKPTLSVFFRKIWLFRPKRWNWAKSPKSIREGAASSGLCFRTTIAHSYLTKTFQKFQMVLLSNFQYIFNEVLLISRSFILIFSKKFKYHHFSFKFHETMSVWYKETQHLYSREAPTSLECGYGYNYDTLFNNCDTLFVNKKDFHSC